MIDIVKLKTFITVADLGSFSKSSDVLYVTQPAITQQIKSLEKTIGCKLLRRQGGKIVLTEKEALPKSKTSFRKLRQPCKRDVSAKKRYKRYALYRF